MKNFQSGRYIQQGYYKRFQPNPMDRVWSLDNMELIQLLGRADRELGRLDMYSEYYESILRMRGYANGFGRLAEVWNALSASIPMMTVS
jgi:hypothetical protein